MGFQVPGWGLCLEAAGHPEGPTAGPSQGIGKVADDQLVWEKLWEQETFLANILYEGRNAQQGRLLQLFQGHETFAVHTSTWVGPRGHVWGQLPASEWCPWDRNGGSLRVGYGTRTSDPVLAHPDHRLCVWLCVPFKVHIGWGLWHDLWLQWPFCMLLFGCFGSTDHLAGGAVFVQHDVYAHLHPALVQPHVARPVDHCTWTLTAITWAWTGKVFMTSSDQSASYEHFHEWFPREACDAHRAEFVDMITHLGPCTWYPVQQCWGPSAVWWKYTRDKEWCSDGMVALCS